MSFSVTRSIASRKRISYTYMKINSYRLTGIKNYRKDTQGVSTYCYLNPGLLYTMHTGRFKMILMHDQQNPLTTSNFILYAPKPECNI